MPDAETAPEPTAQENLHRALTALYLEVPPHIAGDVRTKVHEYVSELEHKLYCAQQNLKNQEAHCRQQGKAIDDWKGALARYKISTWAVRASLESLIKALESTDTPLERIEKAAQAGTMALTAYQGSQLPIALWTLTTDTRQFQGCDVYASEEARNAAWRKAMLEFAPEDQKEAFEKIESVGDLYDAMIEHLDKATAIFIPEHHVVDISRAPLA